MRVFFVPPSFVEKNAECDPSLQPTLDFTSIATLVSQFHDGRIPDELPLRVSVETAEKFSMNTRREIGKRAKQF